MDLFFSPMACSMASRIILNEAGAECDYRQVDLKSKTVDGADYHAINPMGQVPALRTDNGAVITENTAVLQFLARRFPKAGLAPAGDPARAAFSIVDAYLFTVLNWTRATPIALKNWDNAYRYWKAIGERPSVARALAAELPLYRA